MVDKLLTQHGWKVIQTPLCSIADLNRRLQEYQHSNIDEFLFFYTGHGDVSNRQQILKLQLDNTEISLNDVLDSIFKYINPKKQAIVLDACYSGTLKDLTLENNTEFLFSSQAKEQSYEDDALEASVFSFYFCEAVINNKITIKAISEYIASQDSRQIPLPMIIGNSSIKIGLPKEILSLNNKIFLAEVSDDLEEKRNEVKEYLEDYGYDIYPKSYLPFEPILYKENAKELMQKCGLFIQILSEVKGRTPSDLIEGYRQAQFDIAQRLETPIMQWCSRDIVIQDIKDDRHRELLSTEFIQTNSFENFKKEIHNRMLSFKEKLKKKEKRDDSFCNELPFIFINATVEDRAIAQELQCSLQDFCMVAQPLYKGTSSEIREDLKENILECNYYILVYSKSTARWVHRQLMQYRKYDRERVERIRAIFIYEELFEEKEDIGMSFPFVYSIDGRNETAFQEVQQIVRKDRE